MKRPSAVALIAGLWMCVGVVDTAHACSGINGTPVSWVQEADVIVLVRAAEQLGTPFIGDARQISQQMTAYGREFGTDVRFDVLDVLKGTLTEKSLRVEGFLVDRDDPNDRPAPYDFVRPEGRGGDCFAHSYKQSADYLLFLQRRNGQLTPYWASMAAINEQVFGDDDKWLAWVRTQIQAQH
jgi:hypothetical protein